MSGDYHTSIHGDIRELEERLAALESKVAQSNLLMRRPGSEDYEKLVDVVCDHDDIDVLLLSFVDLMISLQV